MAVRVVTILFFVLFALSAAFKYKLETCTVDAKFINQCKGPDGCICDPVTLKCSASCDERVGRGNLAAGLQAKATTLTKTGRYAGDYCDNDIAAMRCQSDCECKNRKCQGTACKTKAAVKKAKHAAAMKKKRIQKAAAMKEKAIEKAADMKEKAAATKKRFSFTGFKIKKPKWKWFKKSSSTPPLTAAYGSYYGDELYAENENVNMSYDNFGFITQFVMVLTAVMIFCVCCGLCVVLNIGIAYFGWVLGKCAAKNSNSNYKLLQRNATDVGVEENQDELVV